MAKTLYIPSPVSPVRKRSFPRAPRMANASASMDPITRTLEYKKAGGY